VHNTKVSTWFSLVATASAVIFIAGMMITFAPRAAEAKPEYAVQTGRACGACHQNPSGSGPLKPAGEKFKAGKKK
jgi:cytochrome c553